MCGVHPLDANNNVKKLNYPICGNLRWGFSGFIKTKFEQKLASSEGNSGYTDCEESEDDKSKSVDLVLQLCGSVTGPAVPWGYSSDKFSS